MAECDQVPPGGAWAGWCSDTAADELPRLVCATPRSTATGPIEVSTDSGATWAPYTLGTQLPEQDGTGNPRFRSTVTVPDGYLAGSLLFAIGPDSYDGETGDPGTLYVDGTLVGQVGAPSSGFTIAVPGSLIPSDVPVLVEWQHGASVAPGGVTIDTFEIRYASTGTGETLEQIGDVYYDASGAVVDVSGMWVTLGACCCPAPEPEPQRVVLCDLFPERLIVAIPDSLKISTIDWRTSTLIDSVEYPSEFFYSAGSASDPATGRYWILRQDGAGGATLFQYDMLDLQQPPTVVATGLLFTGDGAAYDPITDTVIFARSTGVDIQQINVTTGVVTVLPSWNSGLAIRAVFVVDGTWYVIDTDSGATFETSTVDLATGTLTEVASSTVSVDGVAYDPARGVFIGLDTATDDLLEWTELDFSDVTTVGNFSTQGGSIAAGPSVAAHEVSFLRAYTDTGTVDTELDGVTPYTPVGEVGACVGVPPELPTVTCGTEAVEGSEVEVNAAGSVFDNTDLLTYYGSTFDDAATNPTQIGDANFDLIDGLLASYFVSANANSWAKTFQFDAFSGQLPDSLSIRLGNVTFFNQGTDPINVFSVALTSDGVLVPVDPGNLTNVPGTFTLNGLTHPDGDDLVIGVLDASLATGALQVSVSWDPDFTDIQLDGIRLEAVWDPIPASEATAAVPTRPCAIPATFTPRHYDVSDAGSTPDGLAKVSLGNAGDADVSVAGATLEPGQVLEYESYYDWITAEFKRVGSISYDATGSVLKIVETP